MLTWAKVWAYPHICHRYQAGTKTHSQIKRVSIDILSGCLCGPCCAPDPYALPTDCKGAARKKDEVQHGSSSV